MKKFSGLLREGKESFILPVLADFSANQRAHPGVAIETLQTARKWRDVTELKLREIKFCAFVESISFYSCKNEY